MTQKSTTTARSSASLLYNTLSFLLLVTSHQIVNCQHQTDHQYINNAPQTTIPETQQTSNGFATAAALSASSSSSLASSNNNSPPTGECGAHHLCQNGGTCVEGPHNYTCACPEGFAGPYCSQDINECARRPNICQNGATCLNKPGGYQCICVNGWTGHDCSENVDDCSTAACEAGATCIDLVGRFHCECPRGKTGIRCHLDDQCVLRNPCHTNATCDTSFTDGQAICTCTAGFTGTDCSIDIDECAAGSPCEHGGSCINEPGSFRCQCPRGFSGSRCEVNINECETNPCMNDGTCLDEKGGYKCICMPGFTGQKCQIDIDECASNPCQNGAICKDYVNSFRCLCQANYWGERCEFPVNPLDGSSAADYLPPGNPWSRCSNPFVCWTAFKDGKCDQECNTAECLYDGYDCPLRIADNKLSPPSQPATRTSCDEKSDSYCLKNYANGICDQECNNAECGWDGADCEPPITRNELLPYGTMAQGMLVIRVEPAIDLGAGSESGQNVELKNLLRKVSKQSNTILKIQNFRQVEDGRGTEIELIADNRHCQASCYNNTELIANFLSALKSRTKEFDRSSSSGLVISGFRSSNGSDSFQNEQSVWTFYVVGCASLAVVTALIMVISVNGKQKVKEKATVWFPEGFIKPVMSSRNRDPTDRKSSRGVSTLQALGGNFFRGIKRNERNISTNPSGLHSTDLDRCATSTPNGGGIYHEPYDQYDQYGTYGGTESGSMVPDVNEPMTPTPMHLDPINIEGPHGLTPLMVASMAAPFSKEGPLGLVTYGTTGEMNGNVDNNITDLLQRGAQLNLARKDTGETSLHMAARHGRVDAARSLLEQCGSQDVNAQDATGRTPLHAAIAADSLGVFELLIRCRGTDLNAQTHDGTTPLILATKVGTYSMLEELILNECEVTKSDEQGKTALHWAAATNNVDAIRRLLAVRETNKDAQDLHEQTPLFLAAKEGAKNAVEILLNHNANKDISDEMDRSPIRIAQDKHHYDIVRLLEEHQPPTPKSINSVHHSSRQISPFSPIADSNSNSNSSSVLPPPSYHSHTQSGGMRQGGRQAQRAALARSSSAKPLIAEANIVRNNVIMPSTPTAYEECQTYWNNNNNPNMMNFNKNGMTEVYNVPCLKNYLTPSPDSPFSLESMASPPSDQQYQNHPSLTSQKQTGVYI